ncbi:hypothetical protein E4U21_005463 [Claviceps maximensis]|nr:hypothetical protein E4U21_005463 [Claviceps maximensis]
MLDIARHPELVEPLRKEVISVLGVSGWSKHSLYKLKLMDSVMKESQRLKPIAIVSAHQHWDAALYDQPHQFDGYRFYRMRQIPSKENSAQLVSVSPEHMGFGYGLHACPGRFFASEEIKLGNKPPK